MRRKHSPKLYNMLGRKLLKLYDGYYRIPTEVGTAVLFRSGKIQENKFKSKHFQGKKFSQGKKLK